MKSKTKIIRQTERKRNPIIVETILEAKKNENWYRVAELLASPKRNYLTININEICEGAKEGDVIVVPGKVLSQGEADKKINVAALWFSNNAKEKLSKAGCKTSTIIQEIKSNPEAKGVKILEK